MEQASRIMELGWYAIFGGIAVYVLALCFDGKFLFQGIVGVFSAKLTGNATDADRRRLRNNRVKWLLFLPFFMFLSMGRMMAEHREIAREKGIVLGMGYRLTAYWHTAWLSVMGLGYLAVYIGIGAVVWSIILRISLPS